MNNSKILTREALAAGKAGDWHGHHAAVVCPVCGKIFIVGQDDQSGRVCPVCHAASASMDAAKGEVRVDWE